MFEDPDYLAELDRMSPLEVFARAEHNWKLARALYVRYGRYVKENALAIDIAASKRRVRDQQRAIFRAVTCELRGKAPAGAALSAAIDRAAARVQSDVKTVEYFYRDAVRHRRSRLRAMRDVRILLAIKMRKEPLRRVARRFGISKHLVWKISAVDDVRAALDRLHEEISYHRGAPLPKAPSPAARSRLADADPREGDQIIEAELRRWRELAAAAEAMGTRKRARPRLRLEARVCLDRALGIAARTPAGIAAKIGAAVALHRVRLQRGLARAALRQVRVDGERLLDRDMLPIGDGSERTTAYELARWRELRQQLCRLGRRDGTRPALKLAALGALTRGWQAPARDMRGIVEKTAAIEEMMTMKPARRMVGQAIAMLLADANRLAGLAPTMPALSVSAPADPLIDANPDKCIVDALNEWWATAQEIVRRLNMEDAGGPDEATAEFAARTETIARRAEDLILLALETPSMTVAGVCAKLQAAAALIDLNYTKEIAKGMMATAMLDASRLAGDLHIDVYAWEQRNKWGRDAVPSAPIASEG